jgi:hypothetical protein
MSRRVLQCVEWDDVTETCVTEGWVLLSTFPDYMPTVEQAQTVGFAAFAGVVIVAAMSLLLPPREFDNA